MNIPYPHKPIFSCNAALMLAQATQGMDRAAKLAFAATLDLQEPIAMLSRYVEPGSQGHGHVRGQVESISTLALIIRMGDPDLIEGAIRGPAFLEPQAWFQTRDYSDSLDDQARICVKEALSAGNLDILLLAKEVLSPKSGSLESSLNLNSTREHNDAVNRLAHHADAHDPVKIAAIARWVADSHAQWVHSMFNGGSEKARKEAKKSQASAFKSASKTLMAAAVRAGSSHLALASKGLGAPFQAQDAIDMLQHGNPDMALQAWREVKPSLAVDGKVAIVEGWAESLRRLTRSLSSRDADSWEARSLETIKTSLASFALEALSEPESAATPLGQAQRELLAPVMALSRRLGQPAGWTRKLRELYPDPSPQELAALAKEGQWAMVKTRLGDLQKNGVDQPWRTAALRVMEECGSPGDEERFGPRGAKKADRPLIDQWFFKLAIEMAPLSAGEASFVTAIGKSGHWKDGLALALAEEERARLEVGTEASKIKGKKKALRV